jgi:hypothetical protein
VVIEQDAEVGLLIRVGSGIGTHSRQYKCQS